MRVDFDHGYYYGEVKKDTLKSHGKGVWVSTEAGKEHIREGWWRDDVACFSGRMITVSGHIYEGQYRDGKRNGLGTYTWSKGDKYEG